MLFLDLQYGVVPKDTDGFRALLGGHQAKLHSDGFIQRMLQELIVVMHRYTDHWCVDNRTLWDSEDEMWSLYLSFVTI